MAFQHIGTSIKWQGSGISEKGFDAGSGRVLIEVDPRYFRPTEVDMLLGDPTKAHEKLGWRHKTSFKDLVKQMVDADRVAVRREEERRNRHD
jgi:GDPmannose 4,6-dehydratase